MTLKKRKKGSRSEQILQLVLMYGECPYSVLDVVVSPSKKVYINQTVARLKEKGLVRVTGKKAENTKALRFNATPVNRDYIEEKYGEIALENVERVTSCYRYSGNITDQMRWHRMCETGVMMNKIGLMNYGFVEHRKGKDANLYGLTDIEAQEAGVYKETEIIAGPGLTDANGNWFIGSTEYKRKDLREYLKMTYWRFTGVLFGGGTPYMLYSTGNRLMKFMADAEMRSRYDVEMYVYDREPHLRLLNKREGQTLNTAIFFGAPGTTLPYQYLTRKENRKESTEEDRAAFIMRNVNRVYTNVCFVPLDGNGVRQMKMYLRRNWREEMFNIYDGLERVEMDEYEQYYDSRAYDAVDEQGRFTLFFLDGNLHNLYRFKLFRFEDPELKHVVCFPWQEELVEKYMNNSKVKISICEPEELEEYFGDG